MAYGGFWVSVQILKIQKLHRILGQIRQKMASWRQVAAGEIPMGSWF